MTTKKTPGPRYVVVNPRGIPQGHHVFRQGRRRWYEGETYTGRAPEEPLRRGFLQELAVQEEVSDAE